MNTATIEKNILVKDADGIWYSIPQSLEQEFIALKEETINFEFGSLEWTTANDQIRSEFGCYEKLN